jgi:hypothetical protein
VLLASVSPETATIGRPSAAGIHVCVPLTSRYADDSHGNPGTTLVDRFFIP